jgi:hypothetical protein
MVLSSQPEYHPNLHLVLTLMHRALPPAHNMISRVSAQTSEQLDLFMA